MHKMSSNANDDLQTVIISLNHSIVHVTTIETQAVTIQLTTNTSSKNPYK